MQCFQPDLPRTPFDGSTSTSPEDGPPRRTALPPEARSPRNFLLLAAYQVVVRCGWIFKTESVIMPTALDLLGGGAWIRSLLPLLNRFGLSIPPLLMAPRIRRLPQKRWGLIACTAVMASALAALAAVWSVRGAIGSGWSQLAFLVCYLVFFVSTGINQICFNTLQGKLVETTYRGRLLMVANVAGACCAITLAIFLLPRWLSRDSGQFQWLFGISAFCFASATVLSTLLDEPSDDDGRKPPRFRRTIYEAWLTLRRDGRFRRLGIIAALFGSSVILFPHYQALGRGERLAIDLRGMVAWVVVQNLGTAVFSLIVGPLADRRGNRSVLRVALIALCGGPLLAILLSHLGPAGRPWFPLVFLLVGLTPVIIKVLHNYTLELVPAEDHPRYLSTITLCMAVPLFLSPLAGWLLARVGFDLVFAVVVTLVLLGWLMSFRLFEPRTSRNDGSRWSRASAASESPE
jgi:MFS family permease